MRNEHSDNAMLRCTGTPFFFGQPDNKLAVVRSFSFLQIVFASKTWETVQIFNSSKRIFDSSMNRKRQRLADIQAVTKKKCEFALRKGFSLLHKMQGNIQRNTQRIRVRRMKVWSTFRRYNPVCQRI